MEQEIRRVSEDFETLIADALDDDSIPTLYFNGFINSIGTGDVLIVLRRHNKPIAKLHVS
jgi:hypothetical protein